MFFGSKWKMKSTVAAETAAISAWRVLSGGDRVGAVVFDDEDLHIIRPHRSEDRVMQILQQVVECNHKLSVNGNTQPNAGMLNRALSDVMQFAKHDCLIIMISDGFGFNKETGKHITQLSEHNDMIFSYIYDPLENRMPNSGRLWFTDGLAQLELDCANVKFTGDYESDFDRELNRMQSVSRRYAIPMLPCSTDRPVLEQVREQLGHH